jgi:Ras-related protein Rab-7A
MRSAHPFSSASADHRRMKVLLLGDAGVGKTSVLCQFVNREFSTHYRPTVGADFVSRQLEVDGTFLTLQIWDTAGQERFRSLASSYFRGTEVCVLVYDVTSESSFENIDMWWEVFRRECAPLHPSFPFLLLGNKSDEADKRAVPTDTAHRYAADRHFLFHEVSAKTCDNVAEAFDAVVRQSIQISKLDQETAACPQIDVLGESAVQTKKCPC